MHQLYLFFVIFILSCSTKHSDNQAIAKPITDSNPLVDSLEKGSTIVLGGGCFWCIEAVFQELNGVNSVISGYMGGNESNPSYAQVCKGNTKFIEVVKIEFDSNLIKLDDLLKVFWTLHDPTTLDRQNNDVGYQYRSVIFYGDQNQKNIANNLKTTFAAKLWNDEIVTMIAPKKQFFPAEAYHQEYYNQNYNQGYCKIIIEPKIKKVRQKFINLLKK